MSHQIKTIYRAAIPSYEILGTAHQGWYWNRETAERMIGGDGGSQNGAVWEHDVVVLDDQTVLWTVQEEHDPYAQEPPKTTVTEIRVYGDSDDELREATLERLPDHWKKLLGLPHDAAIAATQKFSWRHATDDQMRRKLLILDVASEEARVLGLGDERTTALEDFQAICKKDKEESDARRNHPLVGRKFRAHVPSKDGDYDTSAEYTVREMVQHDATGDVELRCVTLQNWGIREEDQDRTWKASEIRAMLGEEEARA